MNGARRDGGFSPTWRTGTSSGGFGTRPSRVSQFVQAHYSQSRIRSSGHGHTLVTRVAAAHITTAGSRDAMMEIAAAATAAITPPTRRQYRTRLSAVPTLVDVDIGAGEVRSVKGGVNGFALRDDVWTGRRVGVDISREQGSSYGHTHGT